jgi:hypothetical protein
MKLFDLLCFFFDCDEYEIESIMRTKSLRDLIEDFLYKNPRIRLSTSHLEENQEIVFAGFSTRSAGHQYAYNGYQGTTVQQHFYSRHGLVLEYPELPCVKELGGGNHVNYWPIECLIVL